MATVTLANTWCKANDAYDLAEEALAAAGTGVGDLEAYEAEGDGVTDDRAALVLADAAGRINLGNNSVYLVGTSIELTAVIASNGGVIRPGAGVTITVSGPVDIGNVTWIDESLGGEVKFSPGSVKEVNPIWWGASGSKQTTTGSITSGSKALTLAAAMDFENGQYIMVPGAGAACTLDAPATPTPSYSAGSTAYKYQITAMDLYGGQSAPCAALTFANGPDVIGNGVSLISLTWAVVADAYAYAIYGRQNGSMALIGICGPPYGGGGTVLFYDTGDDAVTGMPAMSTYPTAVSRTVPSSMIPQWLLTRIESGGGTTSLTLKDAASATVSAQRVDHDDALALQTAIDCSTDTGRLAVYIPIGDYVISSHLGIRDLDDVDVYGAGQGLTRIYENNIYFDHLTPPGGYAWGGVFSVLDCARTTISRMSLIGETHGGLISFHGITYTGTESAAVLDTFIVHHVTFEGFMGEALIMGGEVNNVIWDENYFDECRNNCLNIVARGPAQVLTAHITNNKTYRCAGSAILAGAHQLVVTGNIMDGADMPCGAEVFGITAISSVVCAHNIITRYHGTSGAALVRVGGPDAWSSDTWLVTGNVHDNVINSCYVVHREGLGEGYGTFVLHNLTGPSHVHHNQILNTGNDTYGAGDPIMLFVVAGDNTGRITFDNNLVDAGIYQHAVPYTITAAAQTSPTFEFVHGPNYVTGLLKAQIDAGTLELYKGYDDTKYTQGTGFTPTRTLDNYTADDESVAYTGINNAQGGVVYATVADLNALRVAYEAQRATLENLGGVIHQLVDSLQNIGIVK